jgi:DNA (cytosine-5)-methyltransferase 1
MIKVFEMFSGYGGASFALRKANIDFQTIGFSEIDSVAIKCYQNNFPHVTNYGDCKKINPQKLPDFNLLTAGFPCQPFSGAGKHQGAIDTRGTLFYDIIRIAEFKQPEYIVLENVKGLTFKNHNHTLQIILKEIIRIGYRVNYKILNSKDFGTPQNRERVIFLCQKNEIKKKILFPKKEILTIFLKDLVLNNVPNKFYLSRKKIFFETDKYPEQDLTTTNNIVSVAIRNKNRSKHQHQGLKYGTYPIELHLRFNKDIGVSYAVKSASHEYMISDLNLVNIRKLTPQESFRLMGFFNDEINLSGISQTGQYRLAGNGWDINMFSKIFKSFLNSEQ